MKFDEGKESFHLMSKGETYGGNLKMLGVPFDMTLSMKDAVEEVVVAAGWKLRMLLRSKRFYTDAELVGLYKTQLLSYLEYRTSAVYHAKREVLWHLDRVQHKFLEDIGVDAKTALMVFNLAPLNARRDMAILGLIQRTVLGRGPKHFRQYFKDAGKRTLVDPRHTNNEHILRCSALGLVAIYNMLPETLRKKGHVVDFPRELQATMKARTTEGCEDLPRTLCPRMALARHPLS